ncbi:MAG: MFS transporter [Anaerolineae bacterium]
MQTTMDATTRTPSRRRSRALYVTAVALYWASLYFYVPTLSVYVESKTTRLGLVGVVLSMYGLWQAVVRLPLGIVADWVGRRKPFIIGGFVLAGLGALTMGLAGDIGGLILGRALTGFAAGSWVLLVVGFSAFFPPEDAVRASGILTAIGGISRMIVTSISGPLNALGGYQLPFFMAVGAAALATVVMFLVEERNGGVNAPTFREIGALITRRDVLIPPILGLVMQYAIWSSTFGFTPNLAKYLGANDTLLGILVSLNVAVVTAGNLATTAMVRRIGARWMVVLSFLFVGLGLGALSLARGIPVVITGQVFMGLASGVGYPLLMGLTIRYVDSGQRATAMGLYQSVYAIGMFSGPWLSGVVADSIGIQPMFALVGGICLILGLIGTRVLEIRE